MAILNAVRGLIGGISAAARAKSTQGRASASSGGGSASSNRLSPYDERLAQSNSSAGSAIAAYKDAWNKAYSVGDTAGMKRANDGANMWRDQNGGYLGGADGSEYNVTRPYTNANMSAASMMQENERRASDMYAAKVRQGTDRLNAQKGEINRGYDDAAQKAYIAYMQGQRDMPQQLSAMGMTGGASESALLGARAGYEGNQNQIATSRTQAIGGIDSAITDLQNSGDLQMAQYSLANADKLYQNYLSAAQMDVGRRDDMDQAQRQNAYQEALLTGSYNGAQTMDAKNAAYNRARDLISMGFSSAEIAASLGITQAEAEQYAYRVKSEMMGGGSGGGRGRGRSGGNGGGGDGDVGGIYKLGTEQSFAQKASSAANAGLQWLTRFMPSPMAATLGGQSAFSHQTPGRGAPDAALYDHQSVLALGLGPIDSQSLDALIASGKVGVRQEGNKMKVYHIKTQEANNPPFGGFMFRK